MTMSRDDVVTVAGLPGWRALLVADADAGEPWGDALAPALLIGRGGRVRAAAEVYQPAHTGRLAHAWQYFCDHDLFCRYLRLCHGTTSIATASSQDTTALIFDTTAYRAHAGITGVADLSAEQAEWQAWLDGDVYGVVVQQHIPAVSCTHCGQTTPAMWTAVESCWGYFGRASAEDAAEPLLRACTAV
ncbi:hypothetical protein [Dactylosporangium sp. CA-233914]|uniref:hypothetical protein n=1 Tax=Dactylosporangium sp. CA-233914 TaxID=3239934 RepID=UPI003D8A10C5